MLVGLNGRVELMLIIAMRPGIHCIYSSDKQRQEKNGHATYAIMKNCRNCLVKSVRGRKGGSNKLMSMTESQTGIMVKQQGKGEMVVGCTYATEMCR